MSGAGERPALNRFARASGEVLLWWVVTTVVWLATLTSRTPAELLVMVACTLPCAVTARVARQANGGHWRFRIGWARWVATVARDVPVQTVQTWRYALKALPVVKIGRRRGVISAVVLPTESEPVAAARRAVAVLAFATTPGTVVLDSDPTEGTVLLHRVRPRPGRLAAAVKR